MLIKELKLVQPHVERRHITHNKSDRVEQVSVNQQTIGAKTGIQSTTIKENCIQDPS